MKKTLATLLAVVMLLSTFCVLPVVSAEESDNASATITISSAEDFLKIGNDNAFPLNGNYKLGNDITVTSDNYAPIGSYAAPFTGTFDGDGKTITVDLTYTNATATNTVEGCAYAGLFGCVQNATVTKLTVAGTMTVNTVCGYVGGIIGCAYGDTTVSYCTSDVDMTVTFNEANSNQVSFVGGVVGIFNQTRDASVTTSDKPTVTYCVNKGNINVSSKITAGKSASSEYNIATNGGYAGIVGGSGYRAEGTCGVQITISYCINYGDIYVDLGPQRIAGILGCTTVYGNANEMICAKADISWCANYGDITRTTWVTDSMAAIAGYILKGTVTHCFNTGSMDPGSRTKSPTEGRSYFVGTFHATYKTASYVANNFTTTPIVGDSNFIGFIEGYDNVDQTKCVNNYMLSDDAVITNKGGEKLAVGLADGKEAILRAISEEVKDTDFGARLVFAGLGDLATVYFDFNAPKVQTLGYQDTDVTNDTYNIRFISILDGLNYASAGYDVVATYGTDGEKTFSKECEKVYTGLTASVEGDTVAYTRVGDDYYIMAYAIKWWENRMGCARCRWV